MGARPISVCILSQKTARADKIWLKLRFFRVNTPKKLKPEVRGRVGSGWPLKFGFFRLRNPEKKLKFNRVNFKIFGFFASSIVYALNYVYYDI